MARKSGECSIINLFLSEFASLSSVNLVSFTSHLVILQQHQHFAFAFCAFVTSSRPLARSLAHSCIRKRWNCFAALSVIRRFACCNTKRKNPKGMKMPCAHFCVSHVKRLQVRENNIQEED
jgi:hypothetical protein